MILTVNDENSVTHNRNKYWLEIAIPVRFANSGIAEIKIPGSRDPGLLWNAS